MLSPFCCHHIYRCTLLYMYSIYISFFALLLVAVIVLLLSGFSSPCRHHSHTLHTFLLLVAVLVLLLSGFSYRCRHRSLILSRFPLGSCHRSLTLSLSVFPFLSSSFSHSHFPLLISISVTFPSFCRHHSLTLTFSAVSLATPLFTLISLNFSISMQIEDWYVNPISFKFTHLRKITDILKLCSRQLIIPLNYKTRNICNVFNLYYLKGQ